MDSSWSKIRTGALLAFAAGGMLLAALALYGLHRRGQADLLRQLSEKQAQLAFTATEDIERQLLQLHDGIEHLSRRGDELAAGPLHAKPLLEALFHTSPPGLLLGLYVTDQEGKILAQYARESLAVSSIPAHLLPQTSRSTPNVKPIWLANDCILLLPHALTPAKKPRSLLNAFVSLNKLKELCLSHGQQAEFSFLLDDKGQFLLHSKPEMAGRSFAEVVSPSLQPELYELMEAMMRGERGSGMFHEQLPPAAAAAGGTSPKALLTYAPLNILGHQWALAFALPPGLVADIDLGNSVFLLALSLSFALATFPLIILWRTLQQNRRLQNECARVSAANADLIGAGEIAQRRSRQLLDNAGDAIFFIDPDDGSLLELNRQAEELLGYTAAEIHPLSLSILFPGRQRRRYLRLVKNVLDNGYGEDDSLLFRRKGGELFTGAVHARLGELGDKRVVHGVLRDITEIKRIERELRQKNQDLTLMNEMARHLSVSRNLTEMLGESLARLVQAFAADGGGIYLTSEDRSTLYLAVHQGITDTVLEEIERITPGKGLAGRVAATGQPRTSADLQKDRRIRSKAPSEAGWRALQAIPLTANRSTVGVLLLFSHHRRIMPREELNLLLSIGRQMGTAVQSAELFEALQWQNRLTRAGNRELKRSRRELEENLKRVEETNRELERLDQMKSNFLAMASHELRTPLTYVLSGADLIGTLLGDRLSAEERQVLSAIHEGGKRLEGIIHDLLEAARIESQSLYLAREEIDLAAMMEAIGEEFRPIFEQRQLTCRLANFPASLELYGDSHHLRKTFYRLIENAVKFTPEEGEIEIHATVLTPSELKPMEPRLRSFSPSFFRNIPSDRLLLVTIRDSGVGIDPDEQVRVFDRFYEVGHIGEHFTSRTRFGGKGVGLGLSLVKGMVEAHGGMVWVESAGTGIESGGSNFHVLLPLASSASEAADAAG